MPIPTTAAQRKASVPFDPMVPSGHRGRPTIPAIVRLLAHARQSGGMKAELLARDLESVLRLPITPTTNANYCAAVAALAEALGYDPRIGEALRELRQSCARPAEHDGPWWYDDMGRAQCGTCLPLERVARRGPGPWPGRVLRVLDLDACPGCLGEGEMWADGDGTGGPVPADGGRWRRRMVCPECAGGVWREEEGR